MNNKGQTLLEVMLAIGIMVFGVISIISLSIASSVMARRTSKELVATQLAREGIEVVHNIRDSNWLAIDDGIAEAQWYDHIYDATDDTAIVTFDPSTAGGTWDITFIPDDFDDAATKIYLDDNNIYRHRIHAETLTNITPYSRLLTITQILDEVSGDFIGLNVKCEVAWNDGGKDYSKIIEENIYDWKTR